MDYTNQETKELSELYDFLTTVTDKFPDKEFKSYSKKERINFRKNLIVYVEEKKDVLSDELFKSISFLPDLPYDELREKLVCANEERMDFLRDCGDEWVKFANRFDEPIKNFILQCVDSYVFSYLMVTKDEETDEIIFSRWPASAYCQTLYFVDPIFSGQINIDEIGSSDEKIEILEDGYRISFVQENEIMSVEFSDVRLKTQLFNYSLESSWSGAPWSQISSSLDSIEQKNDCLGAAFLNEKEKALLPLCSFRPLNAFSSFYYTVDGDKIADEKFVEFALRAGNEKIAELTRIYSAAHLREKKKACKALKKEMIKPSSEALARLILSEIKEAACGYALEVEINSSIEKLEAARKTVTDILMHNGFQGEYPHFKKLTSLKGTRLIKMQDQLELTSNQKNVACMIDCFETSITHGYFVIEYNASTVFLKKDELDLFDSLDGYSGFFPDKQQRRAKKISPNFNFEEDDTLTYDLESSAIAAVKTAQCEKLTKKERDSFLVDSSWQSEFSVSLVFLLITGFLFALLFCPLMFLLGLIISLPITIFSSEAPSFYEMFLALLFEFSWWKMFLFCFVGFSGLSGLAMIIYSLISKKR